MKLVVFGASEHKSEIIKIFSSEGFDVSKMDSLEDLIEMSLKSPNIGYILINPDENILFTISQLKELQKNVGVCVFDKDDEIHIPDICVFEGIDLLIKGIPTKAKLNKLKKMMPREFCITESSKLLRNSTSDYCLLRSFLNIVSAGFLAFNHKGEVSLVNNVFKQMFKRIGLNCEMGNSYTFMESSFPDLFNLIEPYFQESTNITRTITNVETEDGVIFSVNVVPIYIDKKFVSLVVFMEHTHSAEGESGTFKNFGNQLSVLLQDTLKTNDLNQIGSQIITAASKLTGIERVFLSFGFEGNETKNLFNGFFKWEKDVLRNFRYTFNVLDIILNKNFLVSENVYLIPPAKLLDFSDLCLVSEDTGELYKLLFVPIRGKNDELLGILRFDIGADQKPYIKGFKIFQEFISLVAILIENVRLQKQAEIREKFMINVVNNINDVVLVLDNKWKILSANNSIKKVLEYSREEVVGRGISCLLKTDVIAKLRNKLKLEDFKPIEVEIEGFKGKHFYISISPSYFYNSERKKRIVLLISDISYLKKLKDKDMELEKLDAISQAAVTVNDKINTPLTIILAHLGILKYKGVENLNLESFNNSLEVIDNQVNRISEIMNKLRDLQNLKTKSYAQRDLLMIDLDSVDSVDSLDYFDED